MPVIVGLFLVAWPDPQAIERTALSVLGADAGAYAAQGRYRGDRAMEARTKGALDAPAQQACRAERAASRHRRGPGAEPLPSAVAAGRLAAC